jgi:cell division protein FtsB
MDRKKITQRMFRIFRNKYFIAAFAFFVWITVFDENNLYERIQLARELNQLDNDRKYYLKQIEEDAARLEELQTNDENLEKFAREQYLMRKDDEDVFVIVSEK